MDNGADTVSGLATLHPLAVTRGERTVGESAGDPGMQRRKLTDPAKLKEKEIPGGPLGGGVVVGGVCRRLRVCGKGQKGGHWAPPGEGCGRGSVHA